MKYFLKTYKCGLVLLMLLFSLSLFQSAIADTTRRTPRIVGGEEVPADEQTPWMINFQVNILGQWVPICGGSLIDQKWVLTAAHCVVFAHELALLSGSTTCNARIFLGTHNRTAEAEGETICIKDMIMHPANDVALLLLEKPSTQTPIKLAAFNENTLEGTQATVMGWGDKTGIGGQVMDIIINALSMPAYCSLVPDPALCQALSMSLVNDMVAFTGQTFLPQNLQKVQVDVVSNQVCQDAYGETRSITESNLCAGAPGKDSCQGDSGGPLFVQNGSQITQIGVVSSGGTYCAEAGKYGIYVRVSKIKSFINLLKEVGKEFSEASCSLTAPVFTLSQTVDNDMKIISVTWVPVDNASGYRLFYTPHSLGEAFEAEWPVSTLDLSGDLLQELPDGKLELKVYLPISANFYYALQAYNDECGILFSNAESTLKVESTLK